MGFSFMLMFIPGMQVGEFMHCGYQESVRVKVKINRDAVPFSSMRWAIIAEFTISVA